MSDHAITVTENTKGFGHRFEVKCECGGLLIDVPETEVGMIIRIHWDIAHNDGSEGRT